MDKPVMVPKFWRELAESKPTGEIVTPGEVESWFDGCWPLMLDYIDEDHRKHPRRKQNIKRRIKQWWRNVRPEEIAAARQRLAVIATGVTPPPIHESSSKVAARMVLDMETSIEERAVLNAKDVN